MLITAPVVHAAETRIGLNGARPSELPVISDALNGAGLTQDGWLKFASRVGENWLPGLASVPVDYPAQLGPLWGPGALTGDQSITVGQQNLHAAIKAELDKGQTVAVTGVSMGTLVIDRELTHLLTAADAPAREALTFYIFGGEARGFGEKYARGATVPLLGVTFDPVPESQYDVVVVYAQWDGWANPPDRPWHLLSVLNAVMGVIAVSNDHSQAALAHMADAVLVSETTNVRGGTTSTYMIPGKQLPLTRPLLGLGVPAGVVKRLDALLMPLVAAGYSTMTPGLGPHIERGQLVWTKPTAPSTQTIGELPTAQDEHPDNRTADIGESAKRTDDSEPVVAVERRRSEPEELPGSVESDTHDQGDDGDDPEPADAGELDGSPDSQPQTSAPHLSPTASDVDPPADSDGSSDTDGSGRHQGADEVGSATTGTSSRAGVAGTGDSPAEPAA